MPCLGLAVFPGLMLCALPAQAPVPTVHPSRPYPTPGAGATLSFVYAAPKNSPRHTQNCQENPGISRMCLPWLPMGLSVATVGPPPGGKRNDKRDPAQGKTEAGGRSGQEKSQGTAAPHPFEGALLLGQTVDLRYLRKCTSPALRTPTELAGLWPGLHSLRRDRAPAQGREQGSEADFMVLLPSSCLQPCPSGIFLTQATF